MHQYSELCGVIKPFNNELFHSHENYGGVEVILW